jgi:hypothetical protein
VIFHFQGTENELSIFQSMIFSGLVPTTHFFYFRNGKSCFEIKDRNNQEKNNKHNQTQGGTNTIKTINVAHRCFV